MRILIIQLKRAGDVVLTTPIPLVLRRRFPQAQIDFLVDTAFAPVLENHPAIDHVELYEASRVLDCLRRVRSRRYDWVIDFQSSPRSAVVVLASGASLTAGYRVPFWGRFYNHTVKRPGASVTVVRGKLSLVEPLIGPVTDIPERQVFLSREERSWAQQQIPDTAGRRLIGLIPPHRRLSRRWPGSSYGHLARLFLQEGYEIGLFCGPGETDYVKTIQQQAPGSRVFSMTSFRQMAALLERCRLVVSNDNGPVHIAVAVGRPTVTVYGPTDAACLRPEGPHHRAVTASGVPCLGCNLNTCPFEHECMTGVTPEHVFEKCQELLQ